MTSTLQFADAYAKYAPQLPWLHYDETKGIYFNQNTIGAVFAIEPLNTTSFRADSLQRLYDALGHFFNSLPTRMTVQCHLVIQRDQSALLHHYEQRIAQMQANPSNNPATPVHIAQLNDRLRDIKLRQSGPAQGFRTLAHYLSISTEIPANIDYTGLPFQNHAPQRTLNATARRRGPVPLDEFAATFQDQTTALLRHVENAYLTAKATWGITPLPSKALVALLRPFFGNTSQSPVLPSDSYPLPHQILPTHIWYDHTGFHFLAPNNLLASSTLTHDSTATYALEHYPDRITFGALQHLNALASNGIITTTFHRPTTPPPRDFLQALNVQLRALGNKAGRAKWFKESVIHDQKLGPKNAAFSSSTLISIYGSPQDLETADTQLHRIFQTSDLAAPIRHERLFGPMAYIASLPLGYEPAIAAAIPLTIPILTESARSMMPWCGNFPRHRTQDPSAGINFETADGAPIIITPDKLTAPAKHMLVIGTTGSGKSLLLNRLIDNAINTGGAAFAIDPGASMQSNFLVHGGDYHNVTPTQPFRANIFAGALRPTDPETGEPSDAKYIMLVNFLLQAVYRKQELDGAKLSVARGLLGNAITDAYNEIDPTSFSRGVRASDALRTGVGGVHSGRERNKNVTLSVVVSKIHDQTGDFQALANELKFALAPYCGSGQYAKFFDVDYPPLENPVMGINLDGVKEDTQLCTLLLMLFTNHASNVYQERRRLGSQTLSILCIDEVHQYLRGSFMEAFITEQFKVLRKFGVSAVVASQSFADFNNPCGDAVKQSTPYWWLLPQDQQTAAIAKDPNTELGQLDRVTIQRIMDMRTHTGKDAHAPFYLLSKHDPNESGFFVYRATPRDLAIFSTHPSHNAIRSRKLQEARARSASTASPTQLWTEATAATQTEIARASIAPSA